MADLEKCYSRDEERYHDWHDVLDMLDSDGELVPGAVIYEGEAVRRKASHFAPGADWIIDQMAESAGDEAGEFAEDWPEVPKDKQAELEKVLNDWLDANVPVNFFTVENIRKVVLTEDDIADFRGEPSSSDAGVKENGNG